MGHRLKIIIFKLFQLGIQLIKNKLFCNFQNHLFSCSKELRTVPVFLQASAVLSQVYSGALVTPVSTNTNSTLGFRPFSTRTLGPS